MKDNFQDIDNQEIEDREIDNQEIDNQEIDDQGIDEQYFQAKNSGRKKVAIIVFSILLVLCLSILTFLLVFRINEVEVLGNTRYTEEEIENMALTGLMSGNSFIVTRFKGDQKVTNIPFINGFKIEKISNHKVRIIVSEKQIIGYIKDGDKDVFFDKDGLVVEIVEPKIVEGKPVIEGEIIVDEAIEGQPIEGEENIDAIGFTAAVTNVPLIEGLNAESVTLNKKLKVEDKNIFTTIWGIARMVEKFNIMPDKVVFDEMGNATMYYGDVRVLLGGDELLEEKISRAAAILPKLTGMSGELHLEDYKEGVDSIIFSKDVPLQIEGEAVEDGESMEGSEATEDGEEMEDYNEEE